MSAAEALTALERAVAPLTPLTPGTPQPSGPSQPSPAAGLGVDVVDVARLRAAVVRRGDALAARLLTPVERELCWGRSARYRLLCLAGRVAAKEAVRKTLGGYGEGLGWQDVEIGRGSQGEPVPHLSERAERAFRGAGFTRLRLSISHESEVAVAIAVAD
ncbi:holo-[acyl-carrier-protein] synthase [Streptomyces sp. HC44]|uniref:Holo-[acyl-carrier-protein] synthase n=1 Tax=Streptomyces scabichelini TaxID=2711217 RepID=A0A6G4VBF4_9ACTN|nr:holo-ACP synthase [Streptomyces scabichelini]NGO11147.1 holo-[acyl-carrier-protein] synthase [Streptomyces scabichelini]